MKNLVMEGLSDFIVDINFLMLFEFFSYKHLVYMLIKIHFIYQD